ncbi:MAG TPA: MFS transporter [Micromonosporaceae bacterium]|nr:MFS transporter [Micromonosporaceae bacterium]HCU50631.1 MFS transporter [Micromonosporaceae bacterium]
MNVDVMSLSTPGRLRPISLWRNRDFSVFWIGETVSQVGTQVTFIALPLVAVLTLDVSAGELGFLRFAEYLPFLAFSLLFGVWADRRPRRQLMITSYVVRGVLVALVPLLAILGLLQLWTLVMIAFGVGMGAALFEVCWLSYVPSLVEKDRLVEAMGKMSASHSAAEVAGPGLGGLLVQLFTAPFVLIVDALSYAVGILTILQIQRREPEFHPVGTVPRRPIADLVEGLRYAFREPHIRATAFSAAMANFFAVITETVFLLYAVRQLHLSPSLIGLVLTAVGAGGLVGALVANVVVRRWPVGRVYVAARIVTGLAALLIPLAAGPRAVIVGMFMASLFIGQAALANSNVLNSSLRQALTPDRLRGRMNASVRTLVFGVLPLGGLAAGILGSSVGLHATLWVGAIGYAASILPVLASPIPRLITMPSLAEGTN